MGLRISSTGDNSRGLNHEIVRQLEAHDRLGRNLDIAIARQAAQCRSSASADQTANQKTDASRRHAAHQHSKSGATADERSRSLALALLRPRQVPGVESVTRAVQREICQPQLK